MLKVWPVWTNMKRVDLFLVWSWAILGVIWNSMQRHRMTFPDTSLIWPFFESHWISKTDLFLCNILTHVILNILILQLCLAEKCVLLGSSLQSISKNIFQMMGEKSSIVSRQAVKFKEGYCSTVLQAYSQWLCIFISQNTGPQVPCYSKECLQNFTVNKQSNVWVREVWRNIWK